MTQPPVIPTPPAGMNWSEWWPRLMVLAGAAITMAAALADAFVFQKFGLDWDKASFALGVGLIAGTTQGPRVAA